MVNPTRNWLIYSREHNAWWRDEREGAGYTPHVIDAGRYTETEARAILERANAQTFVDGGPQEFAVRADAMLSVVTI